MRALATLLTIAALGGCAEPPALGLFIDTSAAVPEELDEIHVELAVSSPEGRVCPGKLALFNVDSSDDLPIFVKVERGTVYTEGLAYTVTGLAGDAVSVEPYVGWARWPDEGRRDVEIPLDASCSTSALGGPCGEGERCLAGECVDLDLPAELLDPSRLDDASCWDDE